MTDQKTIFMTIFEGAEARNLLRTSVVPVLLSDPTVRIVLFTKSEEKREYYKSEFNDPRLRYEVVPRRPLRGLDRFFAALKFTLLRSATTDLKRSMQYEESGSAIRYYGGRCLNRLLARPMILRAVRFFDLLLVRGTGYGRLFDTYQPAVVLLAHLFDEPEIDLVREAKRRGVKTVGFINSWDKTTARAIIRLLPDKAIVFNNIVKRELVVHDAMRPEDIYVSGLPQYDPYWNAKPHTREEFFATLGLPPEKKLIVYAPMGRAFSGSDWDVIDLLRKMSQEGKFGPEAALFVRFQPNDFFDESELKKRPDLRYDYPGRRFSVKRGVDWDMDGKDISRLIDTLAHMSVLVSYASSIVIDAAIFGKPSVNIGFEMTPGRKGFTAPTQYYKTDHYRAVLATGGVRMARTPDELASAVRTYIEAPETDRAGRDRLIATQCRFTDGRAGERIAKFVVSFLSQ